MKSEKVLPMTVRLIFFVVKDNRSIFRLGAVIFASWSHAFHAHTQDYKKSHTVKSLQSGQ